MKWKLVSLFERTIVLIEFLNSIIRQMNESFVEGLRADVESVRGCADVTFFVHVALSVVGD